MRGKDAVIDIKKLNVEMVKDSDNNLALQTITLEFSIPESDQQV